LAKHLLLKELQSRHEFPVEEFPKLLALFEEGSIKKNEIIFHTGDIVKYCYFILKGCMQQYYVSPEGG
jgi:CRP-like cAMP-binding protein